MALRPVTAICDACVLYPFHLRNILVQTSVDGLYDARWTDEIQDEWTRNLNVLIASLANARRNLSKSGMSGVGFLDVLRNQKLMQLGKRAQRHIDAL